MSACQWALCVSDEGEDGKGIWVDRRACFFSLQTSGRQAINRGDREKQWQLVLTLIYTRAEKNTKKTYKLEEQNNTRREINHINDPSLNDSET